MANMTKEERAKKEEELRESIKKEVESEYQDKINQMMEMIKSLQQATVAPKATEQVKETKEDKPLELNSRITVTSLSDGGVNLKTSTDGTARYFRFDRLGQTLPILYEQLINCINTDRWLFEEGVVYINNADAVREQYLEQFYEKFLTPKAIQNIMSFDEKTIKKMISGTTREIQETIARVIAQKINKGESVDMNKVELIGKTCDPEIDIREVANKLR